MGGREGKKKTEQAWKGALLGACLLAWGLSVYAFVPESVSLKGEGNKVEVQMSPVEKDTVSLQLSMEVQVTKGASAASVSFEFDPGLSGSVKQYRYQEETGILTLYISGDGTASLPEGEDFCLGNVVLNSKSGEAAEATVRVKTDSLRIVNRGYDLQVRDEIYAPGEEKAVAGSDKQEPEAPDLTPEPDGPSGGENPGDEPESGGRKPGTHTSPGDTSDGTASSSGSSIIPERESRPTVGIRTGTGQKKTGAQNPSDPLLPETETMQEEPVTEEETVSGEESGTQDPESRTGIRDKDAEETVDELTFWGIVAALGAGALVVFLMLLEYRRQEEKKRRKKKKKVKK